MRNLQGWREKVLSQAGREILFKAVAQAIPTYSMSYFKLPSGLCKELASMMVRFWSRQHNKESRIHWVMFHPREGKGVKRSSKEAFLFHPLNITEKCENVLQECLIG